jgi:hypothetical protein
MKPPISIAVPPGYKMMKIERVERFVEPIMVDGFPWTRAHAGHWKIWIHTNNFILGTYLVLYDTGKIERVTVRDDEMDQVVLIKPED